MLDDLNDRQRQAATMADGPAMILAGPGTGKTKTLAARIVCLLEDSPPRDILALTFTRKAAEEMQVRVATLLGSGQAPPRITTFHGACLELFGGETNFVTDAERQQIIKQLPKPSELTHDSPRELGLLISRAKNTTAAQGPKITKLVKSYNTALLERGVRDFDDVLLAAYEHCRQDFISPWQHVLVDEFQDTNALQYELLKYFAPHGSLFVIGDPRQSIYGFRGASGGIFERFASEFPQAVQITLTANYRSSPEIVRLTNAIFPEAAPLKPQNAGAGQARAIEVLNEYSEAAWIIAAIEQELGGTDFLRSHAVDQSQTGERRFGDFAILYRSRRNALTLQKLLDESGIPFQVVGEGSPYEQPVVRDLIERLRALDDAQSSASRLATEIIKKLNMAITPDVQQFLNNLRRFDGRPMIEFFRHLDEIAQQDFYDPRADAVTLSTIHAAKGLEFAHVFVIACEEGSLPHRGADSDEEKRLFYVAVTRAKQTVDVLHARKRGGQPAATSHFIVELPADALPSMIDPNMQSHVVRAQKRAARRSQQSLF